jgi:serine/threonine protein kinase
VGEVAGSRRPTPLGNGRYLRYEELGHGGGGSVYRGHDSTLHRAVALKTLVSAGHPRMDKRAADRLASEARVMARLHHPNIASIFDTFTEQTGTAEEPTYQPYIVMELVPGVVLTKLIKDLANHHGAERKQLARELIKLAGPPILAALEYAHSQGVVHRDIKPSNIILTVNHLGQSLVKVVDFGISHIQGTPESERLTATNSWIGTPYYVAPEVLKLASRPDVKRIPVTPKSDIYAVGVLFGEIVTGRYGGRPESRTKDPILKLVRQMMAREPDERLSASEAAAELDKVMLSTFDESSPPEDSEPVNYPRDVVVGATKAYNYWDSLLSKESVRGRDGSASDASGNNHHADDANASSPNAASSPVLGAHQNAPVQEVPEVDRVAAESGEKPDKRAVVGFSKRVEAERGRALERKERRQAVARRAREQEEIVQRELQDERERLLRVRDERRERDEQDRLDRERLQQAESVRVALEEAVNSELVGSGAPGEQQGREREHSQRENHKYRGIKEPSANTG